MFKPSSNHEPLKGENSVSETTINLPNGTLTTIPIVDYYKAIIVEFEIIIVDKLIKEQFVVCDPILEDHL